jgi:hypothetical protein
MAQVLGSWIVLRRGPRPHDAQYLGRSVEDGGTNANNPMLGTNTTYKETQGLTGESESGIAFHLPLSELDAMIVSEGPRCAIDHVGGLAR